MRKRQKSLPQKSMPLSELTVMKGHSPTAGKCRTAGKGEHNPQRGGTVYETAPSRRKAFHRLFPRKGRPGLEMKGLFCGTPGEFSISGEVKKGGGDRKSPYQPLSSNSRVLSLRSLLSKKKWEPWAKSTPLRGAMKIGNVLVPGALP